MAGVDRLRVDLVIDGKKVRALRDHEVKTGMIYYMELPRIDLRGYDYVKIRIETNKEED